MGDPIRHIGYIQNWKKIQFSRSGGKSFCVVIVEESQGDSDKVAEMPSDFFNDVDDTLKDRNIRKGTVVYHFVRFCKEKTVDSVFAIEGSKNAPSAVVLRVLLQPGHSHLSPPFYFLSQSGAVSSRDPPQKTSSYSDRFVSFSPRWP